ncbi:trypsin-like peptidase domain-containing protein [Jonesiaceae bacterium BS-20]|uniref:Trypsin-like peptidase domain-containing protein n=1 Tax=Jonesiaceae bacterium BS-20 TaxID=3120821 RepID=A0AAU7DTT2_9MICO
MTNNEHFNLEPQAPIAQPPYVAPGPEARSESLSADGPTHAEAPTQRFAPVSNTDATPTVAVPTVPTVPAAPTVPVAAQQAPTQPFAAVPAQGGDQSGSGYAGPRMFASVPDANGSVATPPTAPTAGFGSPFEPQQANFSGPAGTQTKEPKLKQRGLGATVTAAALAAVLASAGTAGLLLGPLSDQFGAQGDGSQHSVESPAPADQGATSQKVSNSTSQNPNWQAVSAAVAPTVVAIGVTTDQGQGQGSGVVMDASGYILTNNHVVEGAKDDTVTVTLNNGSLYQAKIVGLDAATDLAVIQLIDPPADLVAAPFADSNEVEVGQAVMAMGNPLGLSQTATTGIVSAIDRPVSTARTGDGTLVVTNAIQIDAAVNPGNSGGPLFNAQGEVIGITSSIATTSNQSGTAGSIGLGFAIPANLAQQIGQQLKDNGAAQHAFLGVAMTDGTATAKGKTQTGAVVQEITAGSPAAEAGIQKGDVIVSIDGKNVTGSEFLTGAVREKSAGDTVTVGVVRGGDLKEIKVTLAQKPEAATSAPQAPQQQQEQQDPTNPNNLPDLGQMFPGWPGQGN